MRTEHTVKARSESLVDSPCKTWLISSTSDETALVMISNSRICNGLPKSTIRSFLRSKKTATTPQSFRRSFDFSSRLSHSTFSFCALPISWETVTHNLTIRTFQKTCKRLYTRPSGESCLSARFDSVLRIDSARRGDGNVEWAIMNMVLTAVLTAGATPAMLSRISAGNYRNEDPISYRPHSVSSIRVRC